MARGYKSYAMALKHRKAAETTIFDDYSGLYYNKKVFKFGRSRFDN